MHDDDDDYQAIDYSKLSADEINEKLIWWWFNFFHQNEIFESYCAAKRNDDTATCAGLEEKFERIAELYDDWGDIHVLPSMYDDNLPEWKDWLAKKRYLFFPAKIESAKIDLIKPDSVELVLDSHPHLLETKPKYSIREIYRQTPHGTLQRLDNADLCYDLFSGEDDFQFSTAEIAALVLKIPSLQNEFHWYPRPYQQDFIDKGKSILSEPDVRTYARTVKNYKDFYEACINDTIHGVFPARPKSKQP